MTKWIHVQNVSCVRLVQLGSPAEHTRLYMLQLERRSQSQCAVLDAQVGWQLAMMAAQGEAVPGVDVNRASPELVFEDYCSSLLPVGDALGPKL